MIPTFAEVRRGLRRDGHEQVRLTRQPSKAGRQHAKNRVRRAVESDRLAHGAGISAQASHPKAVTEHDEGWRIRRRRFVGGERPAKAGTDPERLGVCLLDELAGHAFGLSRACQVPLPAGEDPGRVEDLLMLAKHLILRGTTSHRSIRAWSVAIRLEEVDDHQAIGIGEGQRPEDHRVDQRKDRDVRADAKREHRQRDGRERRLLSEDPERLHESCRMAAMAALPPVEKWSVAGSERSRDDNADHLSPIRGRAAPASGRGGPNRRERLLETAADNLRVF